MCRKNSTQLKGPGDEGGDIRLLCLFFFRSAGREGETGPTAGPVCAGGAPSAGVQQHVVKRSVRGRRSGESRDAACARWCLADGECGVERESGRVGRRRTLPARNGFLWCPSIFLHGSSLHPSSLCLCSSPLVVSAPKANRTNKQHTTQTKHAILPCGVSVVATGQQRIQNKGSILLPALSARFYTA